MVNDIKLIWVYVDFFYNGICNQCYGVLDKVYFDVNGWIGMFNGMIGFISLDKCEECILLKYFQMNVFDIINMLYSDKGEYNEK